MGVGAKIIHESSSGKAVDVGGVLSGLITSWRVIYGVRAAVAVAGVSSRHGRRRLE